MEIVVGSGKVGDNTNELPKIASGMNRGAEFNSLMITPDPRIANNKSLYSTKKNHFNRYKQIKSERNVSPMIRIDKNSKMIS
jgi:hypothetical protein